MAELSPAALAVWEAFNDVAERVGTFEDYGDAPAAALRALANQVVPAEAALQGGVRPGGTGALTPDEIQHYQRTATRRKILAIVAELRGESTRQED